MPKPLGFFRSVPTSVLARLLAISSRRVNQLVVERVLVRDAQGGFDPVIAIPAYIAYREKIAEGGSSAGAFGAARTALMEDRARMARVERLKLEGKLVEASEILPDLIAFVGAAHSKLLAVPNKFGSQFGQVQHSMLAAVGLLKKLLYEALDEFAQTPILTAEDEAQYRAYVASLGIGK